MTVPAPNPVLILFAHPDPATSRINRAMVAAVRGLDAVTVRDLYAVYPDFHIDVRHEQELCNTHQVLVFQHPFHWYSCPALLKLWIDEVLTYGWAYGAQAEGLRSKRLLSAISTGGSAQAYTPEGYHGRSLDALLAPFDQAARLCGMSYLPPFAFHAARRASDEAITRHAEAYRRHVIALRDGVE